MTSSMRSRAPTERYGHLPERARAELVSAREDAAHGREGIEILQPDRGVAAILARIHGGAARRSATTECSFCKNSWPWQVRGMPLTDRDPTRKGPVACSEMVVRLQLARNLQVPDLHMPHGVLVHDYGLSRTVGINHGGIL